MRWRYRVFTVPPKQPVLRVTLVSIFMNANSNTTSGYVEIELSAVETFDEYYTRDYRALVGLAYVLTGSQFAAEDLAQDALVTAHKKWDSISGYDNPGAWVRRVMVNRSTSRFRKLRTETRTLTRLRAFRQEGIEPQERNSEVWEKVRSLPPRQAQVIALYYWDDLSISQIASVLECGTETVKTHLKRGRATLSKDLAMFQEGAGS